MALYDRIGQGYASLRREDPRIAARIARALGDASSVVNVGAGTGSYEPRRGRVVAVEPSLTMLRQRPPQAAPAVRAGAARLPFREGAFEAALAVLTVHHWGEPERGLAELRRVARRRIVVLTHDPRASGFWLADYFPELRELDRRLFVPLEVVARALGGAEVLPVPVPHDCRDGFLGAYWRRPEAYLDPAVRSTMSTFAKLGEVESGLARLRADVASGAWRRRHGALLDRSEHDAGYRLVVAEATEGPGV